MTDILVVVYDYGSLPPTRLKAVADRNACEIVYVQADSAHAREMRPILEMTGVVVDVPGRGGTDLVEALARHRPTGIVTFSEYQIGLTARLAEGLGLPYHAVSDVPAITRKDAQRKRFAERGVDVVRHSTVSTVAEIDAAIGHVGLPLIVKPVLGASSRNTFLATDERAVRRDVARLLATAPGRPSLETAVVMEEFLAGRPTEAPWGDYIAVDCVAQGSDVTPVFVTSKFALCPPFRERGGYGARSVVPPAELDELRDLAARAVRALDIRTGLADVEIKLTEHGPRVIEVNGRLGGWVDDLAVRSGSADPADIAVKAALGRECDVSADEGANRIAFHYLVVPPAGATKVRRIEGVSALRALDHVETVTVLVQPGQAVGWERGTASSVASVTGTTHTHDQLKDVVGRIEDAGWIHYE